MFNDGKFSVQINNTEAIMGGSYRISTHSEGTLFEMQIEKGWQPMPGKLWMRNYKWVLELVDKENGYQIKTHWVNDVD